MSGKGNGVTWENVWENSALGDNVVEVNTRKVPVINQFSKIRIEYEQLRTDFFTDNSKSHWSEKLKLSMSTKTLLSKLFQKRLENEEYPMIPHIYIFPLQTSLYYPSLHEKKHYMLEHDLRTGRSHLNLMFPLLFHPGLYYKLEFTSNPKSPSSLLRASKLVLMRQKDTSVINFHSSNPYFSIIRWIDEKHRFSFGTKFSFFSQHKNHLKNYHEHLNSQSSSSPSSSGHIHISDRHHRIKFEEEEEYKELSNISIEEIALRWVSKREQDCTLIAYSFKHKAIFCSFTQNHQKPADFQSSLHLSCHIPSSIIFQRPKSDSPLFISSSSVDTHSQNITLSPFCNNNNNTFSMIEDDNNGNGDNVMKEHYAPQILKCSYSPSPIDQPQLFVHLYCKKRIFSSLFSKVLYAALQLSISSNSNMYLVSSLCSSQFINCFVMLSRHYSSSFSLSTFLRLEI